MTDQQAEPESSQFDFPEHRRKAVEAYRKRRDTYTQFSEILRHILRASLEAMQITYHSIEARAKDLESFGDKAIKPSETDPLSPKYSAPLTQITDLAGVRIIAFFPKSLTDIDKCIASHLQLTKKPTNQKFSLKIIDLDTKASTI